MRASVHPALVLLLAIVSVSVPRRAESQRAPHGQEQLVTEGVIVTSTRWGRLWLEPEVPVRIHGHPVTLMWDTGFSNADLSLQDVQLPLVGQPNSVGAGTADSLEVGTRTEYDIPYTVYHVAGNAVDTVPPGFPPFAGILGIGLIARYDIEFDGPAHRIRVYGPADAPMGLGRDSAAQDSVRNSVSHLDSLWVPPGVAAADCIPMQLYHDGSGVPLLQLPVRANGVSMFGVFDSGAPYTIMSRAAFDALGLRLEAPTARLSPVQASYFGQGDASRPYDISGVSLAVGSHRLTTRPILMVQDIPVGGHSASEPILNLGLDAIQDRHLFISFSQQRVCLSTPGGAVRHPPSKGVRPRARNVVARPPQSVIGRHVRVRSISVPVVIARFVAPRSYPLSPRRMTVNQVVPDTAVAGTGGASLHFEQRGSQLSVEIPRRLLDTDLFVMCDTIPRTGGSTRPAAHGLGWCRGTLIDGPDTTATPTFIWRLSQEGDSILIRAAAEVRVPILRYGRDSAPVINASTLFGGGPASLPTVRRVVTAPTHIEVEITPGGANRRSPLQRWRVGPMPYRPVRGEQPNPSLPLECGIRKLLKRDPWAASSDVLNPIVYYISADVPHPWLPYVKRGLEAWNAAFNAIGLRHAIYAFSEDDSIPAVLARVHQTGDILNWLPPSDNATVQMPPTDWSVAGVTVQDTALPRLRPAYGTYNEAFPQCTQEAGVIREAPISIGGDAVLFLQEYLFFMGGGGSNPAILRAARLGHPVRCPVPENSHDDPKNYAYCPVPDSLVGRELTLFTAHEMGHALGLQHNFAGRWTYPVDSLRSRTFLARMQLTPTVMDYSLFNYVAQAADRLPDSLLVKQLGPYDMWAIAWLYRPIFGAHTPEEEAPTLARWQKAQDTALYLRGGESSTTVSAMDFLLLGDDAIQSAEYDLQNLAKLATTFDLHEEDMLWEWIRALKQAAAPAGPAPESGAIVHFLLEHVVLGHDPLLQASHITWDSVPAGWDLDRWRRRKTTMTSSILQLLQTLLGKSSPASPLSDAKASNAHRSVVRTQVCREMANAVAVNELEQRKRDVATRTHADSVGAQLTAIMRRAACPP